MVGWACGWTGEVEVEQEEVVAVTQLTPAAAQPPTHHVLFNKTYLHFASLRCLKVNVQKCSAWCLFYLFTCSKGDMFGKVHMDRHIDHVPSLLIRLLLWHVDNALYVAFCKCSEVFRISKQ